MAFNELALISIDNAGNTAEFTGLGYLNELLKAGNYGQLQGFKNRLTNGCFRFNQRLAASNADDTYCFDRWYVLTQTGTVAASLVVDPEIGAASAGRLTQSQASAQRMGLAQIVESDNCRDLRSAVTTLAGRVKLSTTDTLHYAVLEHTGGTDSVTSDVVNSWNNTNFTTPGQFFIAGVNVLAQAQLSCAAGTWRDLTALNATLGASAKNIILFVWTENAVAQNVTLDFNRLQWEPGSVASKFELRPMAAERTLCERYYEKSFALATAPAQNVGAATQEQLFGATVAGANTNRLPTIGFKTEKRMTPTLVTYNPAAANAEIRDITGSVDYSATGTVNAGTRGFRVFGTGNAATAINNSIGVHWTADAEL